MTTPDKTPELSPIKRALIALDEMKARLQASEQRMQQPLAIVGIGCRFPGGVDNAEDCWELLRAGRDAVSEVPRDRWDIDAYFDPDPDAPGKMSTRWGGFLDSIDTFDPELFGISPREAVTMDPQQRLLLEVCWEALERAGQSPQKLIGSKTGVYVGIATSDYAEILAQNTDPSRIDAYFASGVAHSIASGRLSYILGLNGPSLSIDTACSSSLVAVHQACQALRAGEIDMAIAAGVNLVLRPDHGITFSKSRMMAADGRCKTFDARADGFVRAEGCGAIVIKRLADALAHGDAVLAVVRGTATNQDGASSGLTAPNGAAQEALLRAALTNAGLQPSDVGYVEAHGTGTSLGDPIEVRALGKVFGPGRDRGQPLLVGSVKTNFGHLEATAGIAGLIKAVLCVQQRTLPPSLHFETPNPHIAWDELPIEVVTRLQPFPERGGRRIAGVSSFGFSGTNAHILIEAAPAVQPREGMSRSLHVLPLSAKSDAALQAIAQRYQDYLQINPETRLEDLCRTAAIGRGHFTHRAALVLSDREALLGGLDAIGKAAFEQVIHAQSSAAVRPKIVFLFTGQGSQYVGMARELYEREPVVRETLDRCAAVLADQLPRPLLDVMFENPDGLLDQTLYTQPALFALEVAVARLWRSWGVEPSLVLGHSVGEYAAACVAGVFDLETGVRLIATRARLMQSLPGGGSMLAVQGDTAVAERAAARYSDRVSVAARNAPGSIVLSGANDVLALLRAELQSAGLATQALVVSHAFHSPLMEPMLSEFESAAQSAAHHAPQLGWISNLTGELMKWRNVSGAMGSYWRRHVREPVEFEKGLRMAAAQGAELFIEVGPHPVLSNLGRATLDNEDLKWLSSLKRGCDAQAQLLDAVAHAYVHGANIDWTAFYARTAAQRLTLPTYPFQRQRYWVEMKPALRSASQLSASTLLGHRLDSPAVQGSVFFSRVGREGAAAFALDHRVFGVPVLPGTGFIAMMQEAASELLGSSAIALRELAFNEVLPIPETGEREVQLIAHTAEAGTLRLEIFSRTTPQNGSGRPAWVQHATARAGLALEPAIAASTHAIQDSPSNTVSHDAFYADLSQRGLEFGPLFRGLVDVRQGAGVASGKATLPKALHAEASHYAIHPVLLDACVQVLAAAVAGMAPGDAVFLPVQIDKCRIQRSAAALLAARVEARVQEMHNAAQAMTASVQVTDQDGRIVALLEGVQLKRVSRGALDRLRSPELERWKVELHWQADDEPDVIDVSAVAASVQPLIAARNVASGWEQWRGVQPQLDRICRAYISSALRRLGCALVPGEHLDVAELVDAGTVKPAFAKTLMRFMDILAEAELLERDSGGWRVKQTPEAFDADEALKKLAQAYPAFEAEIGFVERCGPHLAAALCGAADPLQFLFPGGDASAAERLYRDSPSALLYNGIVADTVADIVARRPGGKLRILEIGGGTASTTAHVMPVLPAERTEYLFTDVSPLFVARAQEKFSAAGCLTGKRFDVERDPVSQGIEGKFDIIIAANVLHATRNLAETFGHVRSLLADDGVLVALEIVKPQDWIDISFGFTDGWWRFEDKDLRSDYPLLATDQWAPFLRGHGFEDVALLPADAQPSDPLSLNAVIVARAAPAMSAPQPQRAQRRWLLVGDRTVGSQLAAHLRSNGDLVCLATPGAAYADDGDGAFIVDPLERSGFDRLLADSRKLLGRLDAVVHLCALDDELQRHATVAQLRDHASQLQAGALHLAQALLQAEEAKLPPLWIVTRGAVALHGQPMAPLAATLWGWARSLRHEYPEWRCVCVDLETADRAADISLIGRTLNREDGERQIAWRSRAAYVARLRNKKSNSTVAVSTDDPRQLVLGARGAIDDLKLEPLTRRAPAAGEVEIRVRATGLNFRDVLCALGMYPGDPGPLGSECSGEISAVGSGVEQFSLGDAVVAIAPGAFATHVIAKAALVVRKPRALSHAQAASLPNVFLTAQWALERLGRMKRGHRVLIHAAAGGVGLAAAQLAQRAGADVFATAGSEEKRAYLRSLGVKYVFSSRTLDFGEQIRAATSGAGVDLVLNSLAGDFIGESVSVLRRDGCFLEIGRSDIWSHARMQTERPDVAYHTIDLGKDYDATPELVRPMLSQVLEDIDRGSLQLLPLRTFDWRDAPSAFRHMAQARHMGKIVLTQPWAPAAQRRWVRDDASYLITGGLSGLGLATAARLVQCGARHLVLLGRRAPSKENEAALGELERAGAKLLLVQGDVSNEEDVQKTLQALRSNQMLPLAGIVHSAGALDDGAIVGQSIERYRKVFAAKLDGAWLLDAATRGMDLDFIVFFSSAAGLLGSAGQTNHSAANAYLDSLAAHLRAEGRPATSIQWGAWSGIGAAAGSDVASRIAQKGLEPIAPAQGLLALEQVLTEMPEQIGIVSADWAQIAERWPSTDRAYIAGLVDMRSRRVNAVAPAPAAPPQNDLATRLASAPVSKRRAMLQTEIKSLAMKVLSLPPSHAIDLKAPLAVLGLDSLMAVELRNLLGRSLGSSLPATLLFDHPSIDALTTHLSERLQLNPPLTTTPVSAPISSAAADDLLAHVEQMSEEELDRLLAARTGM